jgi:succinate dehydrogenase/fumarate reductase iron-sulfur protein
MSETWRVTFSIYRQKGQEKGHYQDFVLDIDPEEYVLDGVEKIWAFHDRTLLFRHACHHSTCGACGMRVNDREALTCITRIRDITHNGGKVKVDPLRNFPIVSDLVVDFGDFFNKLDEVNSNHIQPTDLLPRQHKHGIHGHENPMRPGMFRLTDCLECGLCVSACPAAATHEDYLGPASLAGAQLNVLNGDKAVMDVVDADNGLWRCHSAYECSEVCPSFVEPGSRIMDLRKETVSSQLKHLFGQK